MRPLEDTERRAAINRASTAKLAELTGATVSAGTATVLSFEEWSNLMRGISFDYPLEEWAIRFGIVAVGLSVLYLYNKRRLRQLQTNPTTPLFSSSVHEAIVKGFRRVTGHEPS